RPAPTGPTPSPTCPSTRTAARSGCSPPARAGGRSCAPPLRRPSRWRCTGSPPGLWRARTPLRGWRRHDARTPPPGGGHDRPLLLREADDLGRPARLLRVRPLRGHPMSAPAVRIPAADVRIGDLVHAPGGGWAPVVAVHPVTLTGA